MSATIDSNLGAVPNRPTSEAPVTANLAVAFAAVPQIDTKAVMQLYAEAATGPGISKVGTGATRADMPQISPATLSAGDLALTIGALQSKLTDLLTQQQTGEVKSNQIDMKRKNAEQLEKVKKWLDDVATAANERKTAGIWGWIKSIAAAVASVAAAVLAVAASPFTGGLSIAVAIIAIGGAVEALADLTIKILEAAGVEVPDTVMKVFSFVCSPGGWVSAIAYGAGKALEAVGVQVDDKVLNEVVSYIKMGVDLLVGLATGVGMYRALPKAVASSLSLSAQRVTVGVEFAQSAVGAVAGVTEGIYQIRAGSAEKTAAESKADKMELMAQISKIGMLTEQNLDDLKKIASQMQSVFKIVSDLLGGEAEMSAQISANMGAQGAHV